MYKVGVALALVGVLSVSMLVNSQATVAQSSNRSTTEDQATQQDIERRIEARQAEREARLRARGARECEFVKTRLQSHLDRINIRGELRNRRHQDLLDRLDTIALRIENNGGDATELRARIVTLGALISDFKTDYGTYGAEVLQAITATCAGEQQLGIIISEARSNLRSAKSTNDKIKSFLKDDLKPYLQQLRDQLASETEQTTPPEATTPEQGGE